MRHRILNILYFKPLKQLFNVDYSQFLYFVEAIGDYTKQLSYGACCIAGGNFYRNCWTSNSDETKCNVACTKDSNCKGFYMGSSKLPGYCLLATTSPCLTGYVESNKDDVDTIDPNIECYNDNYLGCQLREASSGK